MRGETDRAKLERFMRALGERVQSEGTIYLTGGATALLFGWRDTTIDIDIKADPEPRGLFEAIAMLKETLDVNVELASPDQFIPPVPGWQGRSLFIARHGRVTFRHFDPYTQALAKLQRGHDRDRRDVREMHRVGLVTRHDLEQTFHEIEPQLIRYPGIDGGEFRSAVASFVKALPDEEHER
jgi:hypothetical protein